MMIYIEEQVGVGQYQIVGQIYVTNTLQYLKHLWSKGLNALLIAHNRVRIYS